MESYQTYSFDPAFFANAMSIGIAVKDAVLPIASSLVGVLFSLEMIRMLFGVGKFEVLKMLKYLFFLYIFMDYDTVMGAIDGTFEGIVQQVAGHQFILQSKVTNNTQLFTANTEVQMDGFIVSTAKTFMYFFRDICKCILLATGPIAICLGFIPGFGESIFIGWLKNYIHVTFWAFTFLVLDLLTGFIFNRILLDFKDTMQSNGSDPGDPSLLAGASSWLTFMKIALIDYFKSTMAALALGLGYFFTPWLTNKYIGATASSGFIGRMMATAGAAFGVVQGASSFVTSGGKSASNSVQTSKNNSNTLSSGQPGGGGGGSPSVQVAGFASKAAGGFAKRNKTEN